MNLYEYESLLKEIWETETSLKDAKEEYYRNLSEKKQKPDDYYDDLMIALVQNKNTYKLVNMQRIIH